MADNLERRLTPLSSHELIAPQTVVNRILGEMVESSLSLARETLPEIIVRLPIPRCAERVPGSYDYLGYMPLMPGGCSGFIDGRGDMVIRPDWDFARPFREGLALITQGKKDGFINHDGRVVIFPQWDSASPFSEGMAHVQRAKKGGFIDREGSVVIEPEWLGSNSFSEGLVRVSRDSKYGFLDRNGTVVIQPQWDYAQNFSNGLAAVKQSEKWGFIDSRGAVVIPPRWDYVSNFSKGLALVHQGEVRGFIDRSGKLVILSPALGGDDFFSDGLSRIAVGGKGHWKEGFINQAGEVVIQPTWESAIAFSEGLSCVERGNSRGFIDTQGILAIEPAFDFADYFIGGLASVQKGDQWGFIDRNGRVVVPLEWDSVELLRFGKDGPVYRQLIKQTTHYRALGVWLDPDLKEIWRHELPIEENTTGSRWDYFSYTGRQ
jgi:hypothetical protein